MKSFFKLLIVLVALVGMSVSYATECDQEALDMARSLKVQAEKAYQGGMATALALSKSEKYLLDVQYCLSQVTLEKYCEVATPIQLRIQNGVQGYYSSGPGTLDEVITQLQQSAKLRKLCN